MNSLLLLVATAAVGVDFGWQPLSTGGVEYIIQIEPQQLDAFARGQAFSSELPAGLDVRRFRLVVGTDRLPQEAPAPPVAPPPSRPSTSVTRPSVPPPNQPTLAVPPAGDPATFGGAPAPVVSSAPSVSSAPLTPIPSSALAAPPSADYIPPAAGLGAQMGSPQAVTPPASPPTGLIPPVVPPAAAAVPLYQAPDSGPVLKSPAAIVDAVSGALDDPNAPGRAPAAETAQPRLPAGEPVAGPRPPRTLDPDPRSGQLAEYTATPHEAQRPSDAKGSSENAAGPHLSGERAAGEHAASQHSGAAPASGEQAHHEHARGSESGSAEPVEKPWGPLMGVVILLLFSISANVYLGWIAWESRVRYRDLLADHSSMPLPA